MSGRDSECPAAILNVRNAEKVEPSITFFVFGTHLWLDVRNVCGGGGSGGGAGGGSGVENKK